jgi:uncharacterized integral membrane protein
MDSALNEQPVVYQGQFGSYTITDADRRGVVVYRIGLMVAALAFAAGVGLALLNFDPVWVVQTIGWLYGLMWLGLGISLATIHIYLVPLHRLLQGIWLVGGLTSLAITIRIDGPLAQTVVDYPQTIWGVGFTFAALTGIFFKEAFCFNRLETKLLTPLVPLVLLGHLSGLVPVGTQKMLIGIWALLFMVFALRKAMQPLVPDIGDKSVFDYLKQQKNADPAS